MDWFYACISLYFNTCWFLLPKSLVSPEPLKTRPSGHKADCTFLQRTCVVGAPKGARHVGSHLVDHHFFESKASLDYRVSSRPH